MAKVQRQLPGLTSEQLGIWAHIRRYSVPRSMIEESARAREAGDWRAACGASHVDVTFDLAEVARQYGSGVAERLEDDLRHLAPDLVRWHLPRVDSQNATLAARLTCVLASYGDKVTTGPFLTVHTPDGVMLRQRLRLGFAPTSQVRRGTGRVWWTGLRHLWDARCSDEWRIHCGGSDRAPFFEADGTPRSDDPRTRHNGEDPAVRTELVAGLHRAHDMSAAFAAAGVDVTASQLPHQGQPTRLTALGGSPVAPTQWATALAALRPVSDTWVVRHGGYQVVILDGSQPGRLRASVLNPDEADRVRKDWNRLPRFPEVAWRRSADLDLVAAERLTPEELHPLVRAALFPKRSTVDGPIGPLVPTPPQRVRVRCRNEWHHVIPEGPPLRLLAHDDVETSREMTLAALTGGHTGCFKARRAWSRGEDGLSRGLQKQRSELFFRMRHGDAAGVEAMLDAGFDPTVIDYSDRSLLHHLAKVDHERLLPRLLAAGLDVTARDALGNTPLQYVVKHRATPALVRALVAAGGADTPDGWNWVVPEVVSEYQRMDPDFVAEVLAGVDLGTVNDREGE